MGKQAAADQKREVGHRRANVMLCTAVCRSDEGLGRNRERNAILVGLCALQVATPTTNLIGQRGHISARRWQAHWPAFGVPIWWSPSSRAILHAKQSHTRKGSRATTTTTTTTSTTTTKAQLTTKLIADSNRKQHSCGPTMMMIIIPQLLWPPKSRLERQGLRVYPKARGSRVARRVCSSGSICMHALARENSNLYKLV